MSCSVGIAVSTIVLASLPDNNSLPPRSNPKPGVRKIRSAPLTTPKQQQRQPSVAEIERAIGAGVSSDKDAGRKSSLFDVLSSTPIGRPEGSMEKKLRKTGEWLIDRAENSSYSYDKKILMVLSLGVLPLWMFCFLVASAIIRLPFSVPFLDDLIM